MSAERIFSICGALALLGWLVLAIGGRARWASSLVLGVILPLVFAVLYLWLLIAHWGEAKGGFGSLTEVAALFSNRWLLLAGWVHYLAFDLFIGAWEVRDARERGISHFLVIPCLFFTFMFGPAGLLMYFILRLARTKTIGIAA